MLKAHDSSFIKIGLTKNLKGRINNIQTGCPYRLSFYAGVRTDRAREFEKELLSYFSKFNVRGEWFELPDDELFELMDIIDEENKKTRERLNEMV